MLKLEGVDSIDAAETLRGLELRIPEDELEPLPDGSYYHSPARRASPSSTRRACRSGSVSTWSRPGAETRVLVVRGEQGETLLPFAAAFVRTVDLGARRLVVVRPEYLVAD